MWRCLKTALLLILSIWTLNTCAVCVSKPGAIKVTTWDGSKVPVCDTHMCDESLNLLSVVSPIKPTATRFGSKLKNYVADLDQIGGWMSPWHITLVAALTQKQWDLGITGENMVGGFSLYHAPRYMYAPPSGSVGEIGVYKGKFLINIAGHALPEEPVLACDLFANQTNPGVCCYTCTLRAMHPLHPFLPPPLSQKSSMTLPRPPWKPPWINIWNTQPTPPSWT